MHKTLGSIPSTEKNAVAKNRKWIERGQKERDNK
jgi:hypothetical protein